MPAVVSTLPLSPRAARVLEGVARLVQPREPAGVEWLLEALGHRPRVVIVGFVRVDRRVVDEMAGAGVEAVIARSSGVDHIDVDYAEERGLCVANQPEAIALAVAEHALGLALTQTKRLLEGHKLVEEGRWAGFPRHLRGFLLRGSTVGILGLGRIGALVAWHARSLGAGRILYWSRRRKPELEILLGLEPASLERLFSESRLVVAALPLTGETRGLITLDLLRRLPNGAVFVNVGRGAVVEEGAVERLLEERPDVRVALDVYGQEPLPPGHPLTLHAREGRATLTPHFAGYSEQSMEATDLLAARQARHYLEHGEVWNPVTRRTCREARDIPGLWDWL